MASWAILTHPLASSTNVATRDVCASLPCRNQSEMQSLLHCVTVQYVMTSTNCQQPGVQAGNQDQVPTCRVTDYQAPQSASAVLSWKWFRWRKTDLKGAVKKMMTCSEINGKSTTLVWLLIEEHDALASSAIKLYLKNSQIAFFSILQLFYAFFFFF